MSRRDTIIIAVLINAGLLLILFATAISSNSEEDTHTPAVATQIMASEEAPPLSKGSIPTVPGDEVDQVLSQWSAKSASTFANSRPIQDPAYVSSTPSNVVYQNDEEDDTPQQLSQPALQSISPSAKINKQSVFKEITVKKGDILDRIAKEYGTTVQEIMTLNNLPTTQLKIGQILKIPSKTFSEASNINKDRLSDKKESTAKASSSQAQYYVVKSGDNPWLIAKKNHLALDELLKMNSLDESSARRLKPGDKIRIK